MFCYCLSIKKLIRNYVNLLFSFYAHLKLLFSIFRFLYPKQLLSRHYWQPHQQEKFALQDVRRRTRHYLPLVREVGRLALSHKANTRSTDLMSTSVKVLIKLCNFVHVVHSSVLMCFLSCL